MILIIDLYNTQYDNSESGEFWSYNRANGNQINFKDDLEAIANIVIVTLHEHHREHIKNAFKKNHDWYDNYMRKLSPVRKFQLNFDVIFH